LVPVGVEADSLSVPTDPFCSALCSKSRALRLDDLASLASDSLHGGCDDLSPARKALVLAHGHNVTFEDAARRTAQMTYDLGGASPLWRKIY